MVSINWQKIGNMSSKLGQGFMQLGVTSIALKAANNQSIFGMRGCCFNGMSAMYSDPMGISWMPNQQFGYGVNNQYGNAMAYQWGASLMAQAQANSPVSAYPFTGATQQQQTQISKTNAGYAGDIDKNQSTEKGEKFDKATQDGKDVKISNNKSKEDYVNDISDLGKSYGALMDSNNDGKISLDEFTNKEMKSLSSDASASQKAQAKQMAQNAFFKLDQNGDNVVDWKELSAGIATFDTSIDGKEQLDGKLDTNDYSKWSELMTSSQTNEFDKMVQKNYKHLFGKTEE